MSLTVVVKLRAKPGLENRMRAALNEMIAPSMNEEGCIAYEPYTDPRDPFRMVIVEEWTSAGALDFHFGTPHFKHVAEVLDEVLAEPFALRRLTDEEVTVS
ncbi:putative quinol monooxygenase [Spirillospora sp. NPDC048911]|uniref:putative quinol monooxygenase n=1 Tax=Spirillospora sp. NPDC048911 TaxID=3364527 RepID=UPI00370F786B